MGNWGLVPTGHKMHQILQINLQHQIKQNLKWHHFQYLDICWIWTMFPNKN